MRSSYSWSLALCVSLLVLGCEADLGPPCGTIGDCFENAICEGGVCRCEGNYVISGDWTKCLAVISAPYSTDCVENPQCSARMGQGAICSEDVCKCQDGYHYLHGICYKSKDYGDICEEEDDCYGSYNYEALQCASDNTCVCSEGYELVTEGHKTCRKVGLAVGQECFFHVDCKGDNMCCDITAGVCIEKTSEDCDIKSNSIKMSSSKPTDTSPFSLRTISSMEVGSACTDSSDCSPEETMECFLNTCVCRAGYYDNDKACMKEIGEKCTQETDCTHIRGATCGVDQTCRCRLPNAATEDNRSCKPGRIIGNRCQGNEQCMFYGENASCKNVSKYLECQCNPGSHLVEEVQLCVQDKGLDQDCYNNFECTVQNSICDGKCVCQDGFHANENACVKDVLFLGDACLTDEDCKGLTNAICTSNKCLCQSGFFPADDMSCIKGVSASCTDDADCHANLTMCTMFGDTGNCTCLNDTLVPNSASSSCLPVGVYGSACEESVQCVENLGEEGSNCIDGICSCIDGYHYRNEYCWETKYLGQACDRNSQCFLSSGQVNRIHCQNKICECDFNYVQTADLDCRSGVGRSDASAMITGLCLAVALLVRNIVMRDGWTVGRP